MINWLKLNHTSMSGCYGVQVIKQLKEDDLRQVILRFGGVLVPSVSSRDKLFEWAGYLFEAARFRAKGLRPSPEFMKRHRVAVNPVYHASSNYFERRTEKAREAFHRLAKKGPSPTSAMGIAYSLMDEYGQMPARDLRHMLIRDHKKNASLNSVRSYVSRWRKSKKEERVREEA